VQNAVIGIIVAISFVGLTVVALRSRRVGSGRFGLQIALGAIIGALAAAISVSIRADLVPDTIEATIAVSIVLLAAVAVMAFVIDKRLR
jgi:hypothetical protein